MRCAAKTLELELMPDHSVIITLRCADAYEAAILYEDIHEHLKEGLLQIEVDVKMIRADT